MENFRLFIRVPTYAFAFAAKIYHGADLGRCDTAAPGDQGAKPPGGSGLDAADTRA